MFENEQVKSGGLMNKTEMLFFLLLLSNSGKNTNERH